jgi:hypothetical protein
VCLDVVDIKSSIWKVMENNLEDMDLFKKNLEDMDVVQSTCEKKLFQILGGSVGENRGK